MFSKFRENSLFCCYYEPFHHLIENLRNDNIEVMGFGKRQKRNMNHPIFEKPHFDEYRRAITGDQGLTFYKNDFAYKEFTDVKSPIDTKNYIDHLIDSCPPETIPLLQFNRSSLRIGWFRSQYPKSIQVYLLRSPRNQFESYYRRAPIERNVFLQMNLLIILYARENYIFNKIFNKFYSRFSDNTFYSLDACRKISKKIKPESHYKIFIVLWMLSCLEALAYCDEIIDMDSQPNVGGILNSCGSKFKNVSIDFNDFNTRKYSEYCCHPNKQTLIENNALSILRSLVNSHKNISFNNLEKKLNDSRKLSNKRIFKIDCQERLKDLFRISI